MARKIPITFASSAVADLEEILRYYARKNVPSVGERLVNKILSQTENLSKNPDMGRVVPEFGLKNLRELIRSPFRIVYRRDKTRVRIVRIWRSERLLKLPEDIP